jgi:hypothetical protein
MNHPFEHSHIPLPSNTIPKIHSSTSQQSQATHGLTGSPPVRKEKPTKSVHESLWVRNRLPDMAAEQIG